MRWRIKEAGSPYEQAGDAWERMNPDKVSDPACDAERSAWVSGYLGALADMGFVDDTEDGA